MSEVVTTELVIDADVSGANTFIQAMEGAEKAVQGTAASATGMWAALGGATAVAAITGLNSVLDQVAKLNKGLADLKQTARETGLTIEKYQSYKFAANVSGLDDKDLNNGLQKSAALLNDAQRNANSLTKIFDANGLSVKNTNGQLISENQLLDNAANLVKRAATEQDKIKIAEMLGFTKQWVPFLEQGADAISRTASEAEKAGAVIDQATIDKADDFDKAWKRSSTEWSVNLRAAAASVLPYIDDLITAAGNIFTKENLKAIAKPGQDEISGLFESIGIPKDKEITIGLAPELAKAFEDYREGSIGFIEYAKTYFANFVKLKDPVRQSVAEGGEGPWQEQGPWTPAGWKKPKADTGPKTAIPATDVANDQLDRAIDQLEKHTARTEADTKAVGLGVGALSQQRGAAKPVIETPELRMAA